jgi:hypothetical protein
MEQIYKDRWTKLFDFLAQVPQDRWDFASFTSDCGTTHCAGGWLPTIDYRNWCLDDGMPKLISDNNPCAGSESLAEYFAIEEAVALSIFVNPDSETDVSTPLSWIEHAMGVLKWEKQS